MKGTKKLEKDKKEPKPKKFRMLNIQETEETESRQAQQEMTRKSLKLREDLGMDLSEWLSRQGSVFESRTVKNI